MAGSSTGNSRIKLTTLTLVGALLATSGCETTTHEDQGTVLGGVLGGVLGSQVGGGRGKTVAVIAGTIAGSMIGRHIGESMDETDRQRAALALNDAQTGQRTTWVNPDTGHEYTVTPTRTYEQASGPCREFHLDATVGGEPNEHVWGSACLQPDGSWLLQ